MTEVSAHSAGYEEVPRVWPFNATHKLGPDVRELLSMHCSWCVLDCGEAQNAKQGFREFQAARRTIQGYEAIHIIRKGQARWVAGNDLLFSIQFIDSLF